MRSATYHNDIEDEFEPHEQHGYSEGLKVSGHDAYRKAELAGYHFDPRENYLLIGAVTLEEAFADAEKTTELDYEYLGTSSPSVPEDGYYRSFEYFRDEFDVTEDEYARMVEEEEDYRPTNEEIEEEATELAKIAGLDIEANIGWLCDALLIRYSISSSLYRRPYQEVLLNNLAKVEKKADLMAEAALKAQREEARRIAQAKEKEAKDAILEERLAESRTEITPKHSPARQRRSNGWNSRGKSFRQGRPPYAWRNTAIDNGGEEKPQAEPAEEVFYTLTPKQEERMREIRAENDAWLKRQTPLTEADRKRLEAAAEESLRRSMRMAPFCKGFRTASTPEEEARAIEKLRHHNRVKKALRRGSYA